MFSVGDHWVFLKGSGEGWIVLDNVPVFLQLERSGRLVRSRVSGSVYVCDGVVD